MAILAFDVGTSSVKTTLVGNGGRIIDSASRGYETVSPWQAWAEQDPLAWFDRVAETARELLARNEPYRGEILCVGVCGHMLGLLPVDAAGAPLRPSMIHADSRASEQADFILNNVISRQALYAATGSVLNPQSPLCKALWLKQNEPEVYAKTARFLHTKDYIVSRLTGNIDVTDFSDASHSVYIDIHKKEYLYDIFAELGLDKAKFPAIYKGVDVAGALTAEAARILGLKSGVPVIAGGGDGACANTGVGISAAGGGAYINLGTTAWISMNSLTPVIDGKARIFDIMALDGETFGVFGTMQAAGKCVAWLSDLLSVGGMDTYKALAAEAPPCSDGLLFLPYLEGERAPIFDSSARGVFFGINPGHTRAHFCRSVLEGVAFALRSIADVFGETGPAGAIGEMRVIGGGASNELWMRIISDVCGVSLETGKDSDSITSLGVALAAAVGAGIFKTLDEAAQSVAAEGRITPDASRRPAYDAMYAKFLRLYPQIKDLF